MERAAFLQVRIGQAKKSAAKKVQKKKKDGEKDLKFAGAPRETGAAQEYQGSRMAEVDDVQHGCSIGAPRSGRVGLTRVPHLAYAVGGDGKGRSKDYDAVPPLSKSRFVRCGNFEDTDGLKTDGPVVDVDAHNLVASWCASSRTTLRPDDIANMRLQGRPVDRVILCKMPRGGIPEEVIPDGAVLAARVTIYGARDAERGFWLELKSRGSTCFSGCFAHSSHCATATARSSRCPPRMWTGSTWGRSGRAVRARSFLGGQG